MFLNLLRGAITNALKEKLLRTYGPLIRQSFGRASLGILTADFAPPQAISTTLGRISLRHKRTAPTSYVKHDKKRNHFYIDAPGCKATLEYEWDKQIVRILSTDVPDACSGRGYGKLLAEQALTWCAQNNYRVIIECDFVENYVQKNVKFQKIVIR